MSCLVYDLPFPPPCRLWSVISILDLVVKRTPGMYANVCGFAWTATCLNPNGWKIPKTKTPKCQRNVVRGRCARSMLALREIFLFSCLCFHQHTKTPVRRFSRLLFMPTRRHQSRRQSPSRTRLHGPSLARLRSSGGYPWAATR